MAVDITLTFTDDEIDDLIAGGYTALRLARGLWAPGTIGLSFDAGLLVAPVKQWTIVDGTLEYTYTDEDGHADSTYVWAPWGGVPGIGVVRPAFEPVGVRLSTLLIALAQSVDPVRFVYSTLTSATDADTFADTKITEPDNFYNNLFLLMLSGNHPAEWRQIENWTQSGGVWELLAALGGSPGNGDEYLVMAFNPDVAVRAIHQAIGILWPTQGRRFPDESLLVTAGEQVYSNPPPMQIVEAVEWLPSTDSLTAATVPFEDLGDGRFRLNHWMPPVGATLRVTGLAPLSEPYDLDGVVELKHPAETAGLLAEAERILRSDPSSGLEPSPQRLATLAATAASERLRLATQRRITVIHPFA